MPHSIIQTSFANGELAPSLFARVDLKQFRNGAATMRNFFVDYRSGASTRQGTKYVVQTISSNARIIPFQTSVLTPYILEFGDHYVRPISMGASVLEAGFNITNVVTANPVVVTAPGHNFVPGDWVFIQGVQGTVQVNGRFFQVLSTGLNTITLATPSGVPVNGALYSTYTTGGTVGRLYKFTSPYAEADLPLVKYVQIANTMYLVHPNYPPQILTFVTPTNWTIAPLAFGTGVGTVGTVTAVPSTGGSVHFGYVVTANDSSGQEGVASPPVDVLSVNIGTTAGSIRLTWAPVTGAASYNIYKAEPSYSGTIPVGASYGFIGSTNGTTFDDTNIVPDFVTSPPIVRNPFDGGNNPQTVCFFQQRLYFGGSNQFPQTFWGSQPGFYTNFNVSDPPQADDAITGTLVSRQVNAIKWMVPMPGGLLIGTAGGAWQLSSGNFGSSEAVTPINATATPQAHYGASDVPPIVIGADVLFVQRSGMVRDLSYNINNNIYTGADISVMSNHLFFNFQVTQWAYAEEPFRIVWAIRNDGQILSLTYVKEQDMLGWGRHDTYGVAKSIAAVLENALDAVYMVVQRPLVSGTVSIIERMANRSFLYGAEDAFSVDSGLTTAGVSPPVTLFMSAASGTGVQFNTGAVPTFNAGQVGQIIRAGGGIATITQFVSPTQVTGDYTRPMQTGFVGANKVPVGIAGGQWTISPMLSTVFGLDYLEGDTVQILADGNVLTPQVVTNGSITMPQPASKITAGLKYLPQLQTMYLDMSNELDTIQGKRKTFNGLTIRVNQTRGLSFGQVFSTMFPIKEFNQSQILGSTIELVSGDEFVRMDPRWDVEGQVCLQQDNPLPASVLGVVPQVEIGDNSK